MHAPYVTRFAPSPTGKLHLGGARTAEFNWLAARASGGEFILRIDDTDAERSKEEYVDEIKRGLEWLGLTWDEEYRQSERLDWYRCDIDWLINNGLAVKDKDDSVRLDLPEDARPVCWQDTLIGNVPISDKDWEYARTAVIARSGYMPLYNFTSICDDMTFGVNYVIRGTDHITNTALQSVIKHVLWKTDFIQFTHVGLIHSDTGKKMSKREGDDSFLLSHYIDKGYLPEAMFDCLLRLGWGAKNEDKSVAVLTRERALELFLDGGNLRSSPAKFDLAKLDSFNRKHRGILAKS